MTFTTIDPNYFQGGRPRYQTHGAHPWIVIEDLACDQAKDTWKRYHGYFDDQGTYREGPLLFRSMGEKREYYARYGFRPNERGEVDETAFQTVVKAQKELRPKRRSQILRTMQAYGLNDLWSRLSRDQRR